MLRKGIVLPIAVALLVAACSRSESVIKADMLANQQLANEMLHSKRLCDGGKCDHDDGEKSLGYGLHQILKRISNR